MELNVSSSFKRFLDQSESRVAQFISRALRYQHSSSYRKNHWATKMITDTQVNYLTLREDGTISYLPKGKDHVLTDDGRWARDNRQNGRPSVVIKKVLTPNAVKLFSDKEFETFVNSYKSTCDAEQKHFVIRPNVDIPDVYCMSQERGGGTLGDSCMNGDRDYLEMYKYVPGLRILCLMNKDGELAGRALLWTLPDGNILCDRMYVAADHYYDMFIDYVDKEGWIRKDKFRTYSDKTAFVQNGDTFNRTYTIKTQTDFDYYPYIDTFSYGGDGYLSNNSGGCVYEYCNTDGSRHGDDEDEDMVYCEHSGRHLHIDDCRYIERGTYAGYYIDSDLTTYCHTDRNYYYEGCDDIVNIDGIYYRYDDDSIVEIGGDYYHVDDSDVCYCEYDGEYRMKEDCHYSEFHSSYIHDDDCVYSEHHEDYILNEEAYEVAGQYFHETVVNKVA